MAQRAYSPTPAPRPQIGASAAGRSAGTVRPAPEPGPVDRAALLAAIDAQTCPWCGRTGLRSLANHTVRAHQIYAHELRELAGLPRAAALCSSELSEAHRELAVEQGTTEVLQRPEARRAAAASREANYDDVQRRRRVEHLNAVRSQALEASRRVLEAEKDDPELAARRRAARSSAGRAFRTGVECLICGAWFCSAPPVGHDYRQRQTCSEGCHQELLSRIRRRTWVRSALKALGLPAPPDG